MPSIKTTVPVVALKACAMLMPISAGEILDEPYNWVKEIDIS